MTAVTVDDPRPQEDQAQLERLEADVRAYVEGPGEGWAERIERERAVPEELWEELAGRGYLSLAAPAAYGGRELRLTDYLKLLELFSASHGSLRMIVHVCNGIWRPLHAFGTEEQRRRLLPALVAGKLKLAFTLTEPRAGTGADIRCQAERHGDTYRLTGEKHLITFGTIADYLLVIARRDGTRGSEGTLALLVERDAAGVRATPMAESMGVRGTDHAHLAFEGAEVPVANRLGDEGEGLAVALGGFLAPSRISLAMSCVGLARRALELSVAYASERETFGRRLAERQAISFRLAEMATDVEAARGLVMRAARQWECDGEATEAAAMAKLFAAEMLQRVTDGALRVHGGGGYFSSPMERVYRDARAQLFEEGTAEIQKMTIARGLLPR